MGRRGPRGLAVSQSTLSLKQIRDRIENSEEVIVDQRGTLRLPDDPAVAKSSDAQKTKLKPSRWY
jgi:hypothetical protein